MRQQILKDADQKFIFRPNRYCRLWRKQSTLGTQPPIGCFKGVNNNQFLFRLDHDFQLPGLILVKIGDLTVGAYGRDLRVASTSRPCALPEQKISIGSLLSQDQSQALPFSQTVLDEVLVIGFCSDQAKLATRKEYGRHWKQTNFDLLVSGTHPGLH
jgi:hypothetical protein